MGRSWGTNGAVDVHDLFSREQSPTVVTVLVGLWACLSLFSIPKALRRGTPRHWGHGQLIVLPEMFILSDLEGQKFPFKYKNVLRNYSSGLLFAFSREKVLDSFTITSSAWQPSANLTILYKGQPR